ncbi:putative DNA-binding protein [Salinibacter ruber]|jgi:predicted DNA-binding protein|uniref:hypothetical protein n=1 Tax=Salinibacter ruber TaxID=146919 RepID=UPI002166C8D1|nr:hypothetical protein [Salinibacter ruber]MCS3660143.1 putative DNA-binding protein [Salinibacter ruber]
MSETEMSSESRGRPVKDPENRRSKPISVKLEPSRKEILRQEASLCGEGMSEVFRKNAFEEIEPQGRPIPSPNVLEWLLAVSGKLSKKAHETDAEWLLDELGELGTELRMKAVEVQQRRVKREKWRAAAKTERVEEQITFRLTGGETEWLEALAESKGKPMRTLLREAAFRGIRKREQMEEIEARLSGWAETGTGIRQDEEGEDKVPQNERRVRRTMKRLAVKMTRFVEDESNGEDGH